MQHFRTLTATLVSSRKERQSQVSSLYWWHPTSKPFPMGLCRYSISWGTKLNPKASHTPRARVSIRLPPASLTGAQQPRRSGITTKLYLQPPTRPISPVPCQVPGISDLLRYLRLPLSQSPVWSHIERVPNNPLHPGPSSRSQDITTRSITLPTIGKFKADQWLSNIAKSREDFFRSPFYLSTKVVHFYKHYICIAGTLFCSLIFIGFSMKIFFSFKQASGKGLKALISFIIMWWRGRMTNFTLILWWSIVHLDSVHKRNTTLQVSKL